MRAIDGEELMDRVDFILSRVKTPEIVSVFQKLKSYLENAPTLTHDNLRPKGRWEPVDARYSRCTNCKRERNIRTQIAWAFCPSCGADMRGGGEDD